MGPEHHRQPAQPAGALIRRGLACAAGLWLAGCALSPTGGSAGPPGRDERCRVTVDGQRRRYVLRVPRPARAARPLVVALHGHGDSIARLRRRAGLEAAAAAGDFLIAYPEGTGWLGLRPRGWNAGNCCGYARQRGVDDVAFLRAVVADVARRHPVEAGRVYAAGVSNGAMMAQRLACEAADVFAGAASVAGTLGVAACEPVRPVSVLAIHGTADRLVPYQGGVPARPGLPPRLDWPVPSVMSAWAARNGCRPAAARALSARVEELAYEDCAAGAAVKLYTVAGLGHRWPTVHDGLDATDVLLEFFQLRPSLRADASKP